MSNQDISTDDYIKAIQYAKDNGHTVNVDFSTLPKGVDAKQLASAMGEGLSDDHNNALGDAANNGHTVTQDFAVTHPWIDAAEKTAELGGLTAGGAAGATAGAITSPVTGPVGPVAGSILGGGLGYGAVKSGADALNGAMGWTQPKPLGEATSNAVGSVGEGSKMAAMGEAVGGVLNKGIEGAQAAYPWVSKMLNKIPLNIGRMFMEDPSIPSKYSGSEMDVSHAVGKVQEGLEAIHQQASDTYGEALKKLGLAGPQTADAAAEALSNGETRAITAQSIGDKWLDYRTNPNLNDQGKLSLLSEINQDINSHLKWAKMGQSVDPISNQLTPTLQKLKTGVQAELATIPGGSVLQDADAMWHGFRQLYNILQPNLADTGKATKWLETVISDGGAGSDTAKAALNALDKAVGTPVAEIAQKQIVSNILKRPLADSMLGKMAVVMGLAHPNRLTTLPMVGAAQSPTLQTKAMQGLIGLKNITHLAPEAVPPVIAGLRQGVQGVAASMPGDKNDLLANQSR